MFYELVLLLENGKIVLMNTNISCFSLSSKLYHIMMMMMMIKYELVLCEKIESYIYV